MQQRNKMAGRAVSLSHIFFRVEGDRRRPLFSAPAETLDIYIFENIGTSFLFFADGNFMAATARL